GIPREGVAELLSGPFCGGVGGDAEVEDPASVMSQHQEYVEDLEAEGRNSEEVHRYQILHVILQGSPPRLGWRLPVTNHVLAHSRIRSMGSPNWASHHSPFFAHRRLPPAPSGPMMNPCCFLNSPARRSSRRASLSKSQAPAYALRTIYCSGSGTRKLTLYSFSPSRPPRKSRTT